MIETIYIFAFRFYYMKDFNSVLYKNIGAKIKSARNRLNLSQEKLAEGAQISRASISNIELGRHQPPLHVLYNIAQILQLDIQLLLPSMHDLNQELSSDVLNDLLNTEDLNEETKKRIATLIKNLEI